MSHTRTATILHTCLKHQPTVFNGIRQLHSTRFLEKNVAFNLSDIGEGIREVVVKEWFVKEGDKVAQFDNICEVQSDKASVTITSRYDGVISKLHYKIDDIALVGKPLVNIETDGEGPEEPSTPPATGTAPTTEPQAVKVPEVKSTEEEVAKISSEIICIPSVRRLAKEHSIDLSKIQGTGKNGRILKEDLLQYLQGASPEPPTKSPTPYSSEDRKEAITGFRRVMVKTMSESLKVPHFVYSDEVTVTKLSQLRKSLKSVPELQERKISFMPFIIKAASNALKRYPIINATTDENLENIIYKGKHNIGIAMDTKVGLAVPVIKDVANLSVLEIADELNRLLKSGKDGNFAPSDVTGATFSISNIGVIGGTYMKPVISPPQVAIIAIGKVQAVPRFDEQDNVIKREIINVSASADHRIIDGATMANFIQVFKRQIENPTLLFLDV